MLDRRWIDAVSRDLVEKVRPAPVHTLAAKALVGVVSYVGHMLEARRGRDERLVDLFPRS